MKRYRALEKGEKVIVNNFMFFAIPSYNRPKGLKEKTLTTLSLAGVSPENIYVFVNSEEQKNLYGDLYVNVVITNTSGIGETRNYMSHYFDTDTDVVYLDDDIEKFGKLKKKNGKNIIDYSCDWYPELLRLFEYMEKYNCYLGGFYPVANPFFMKNRVNMRLSFIIGAFHVVRAGAPVFDLGTNEKEDYERSILFYKEKLGLVRLDYMTFFSKFYINPGGCQDSDRTQTSYDAAKYLKENYPDYVSIKQKKKNGSTYEVSLIS